MNIINELLDLAGCEILDEMAQKQGVSSGNFLYYTLDNEYPNHKPHIHICVSFNDKRFLNISKHPIKNSYNILCSIVIPPECELNFSNFHFEETYDNDRFITKKYISEWIEFLNNQKKPYKNILEKSLIDYMVSNCNAKYNNEYLNAYMNITGEKYDPNSLNLKL